MVNYRLNFVDPNDPGFHTQHIERMWRTEKAFVGKNAPAYDHDHDITTLDVFMYKRLRLRDVRETDQAFQIFIQDVVSIYPGYGQEPQNLVDNSDED